MDRGSFMFPLMYDLGDPVDTTICDAMYAMWCTQYTQCKLIGQSHTSHHIQHIAYGSVNWMPTVSKWQLGLFYVRQVGPGLHSYSYSILYASLHPVKIYKVPTHLWPWPSFQVRRLGINVGGNTDIVWIFDIASDIVCMIHLVFKFVHEIQNILNDRKIYVN